MFNKNVKTLNIVFKRLKFGMTGISHGKCAPEGESTGSRHAGLTDVLANG